MIILLARNELWVGDGDGTIKVINLFTSTIIASINTTSAKRADEFGYDPINNIVVIINPNKKKSLTFLLSRLQTVQSSAELCSQMSQI